MRIPKNLLRLRNKKEDALLLVTGKQDAVIYKASQGTGKLEKVDCFSEFQLEIGVHLGAATTAAGIEPRRVCTEELRRAFDAEM